MSSRRRVVTPLRIQITHETVAPSAAYLRLYARIFSDLGADSQCAEVSPGGAAKPSSYRTAAISTPNRIDMPNYMDGTPGISANGSSNEG